MTCKTQKQNRKTVLENQYPPRSFGAAIPLRSAQTELHSTIDLQHTTAEHVALMQNTKAQRQQRREKSHLDPSVPLRAQIEPDSAAKWRRLRPSCARANFSLQRNLRLPEKMQCFVQVLTFKSIYDVAIPMQVMTRKTQAESQDATLVLYL